MMTANAMNPHKTMPLVLALAVIGSWLVGCASFDVKPPAARAYTGYVDFYPAVNADLAWEVRRWDAGANRFRTEFSKLDPVPAGVLRLAFRPGTSRLTAALRKDGLLR